MEVGNDRYRFKDTNKTACRYLGKENILKIFKTSKIGSKTRLKIDLRLSYR